MKEVADHMTETPDLARSAGIARWLPARQPIAFTDAGAVEPGDARDYRMPDEGTLLRAHRAMVIGRRFDEQANTLALQGRLAVYPSTFGQEACQVAAALTLRAGDWLFPTYRDAVALVTRGIDPVEVLTLLRGDWHSGYDPVAARTAPQCTPLATHAAHAVGLAHAERLKGADTVALAMLGDGATSEGDFHEALNLAGVLHAPVVFLVQNNGYAISVPRSAQCAAPSLAHKGLGYGARSEQVDGNDAAAMLAVLGTAIEDARGGGGPWLVEAHTYRIAPHTSADDPSRYRPADEVERWRSRDPIARLERRLRSRGLLDDATVTEAAACAEALADELRRRFAEDPALDPAGLFDHVFTTPTPQLAAQRAALLAEREGR
jgi:2-oxoisovalerate dehydrogenase E1 component alpha subunit